MALLKVQALQGSPPAVAAGGHGKAVDGRNRPQLSHSPLGKPLRAFPQPLGKPADGFPTGTDPSTTTISSLFSMRRPTPRAPRRLARAGPLSALLHHDPPSGNRPEFPEWDRPDFLEPAPSNPPQPTGCEKCGLVAFLPPGGKLRDDMAFDLVVEAGVDGKTWRSTVTVPALPSHE